MSQPEPSNCKKLLQIYLTREGSLRFIFEPGAEEMIEAHNLHGLVGDVIAEFGENFRFKNRTHTKDLHKDGSRIIIPKGATF
jgi:hypothetical protein